HRADGHRLPDRWCRPPRPPGTAAHRARHPPGRFRGGVGRRRHAALGAPYDLRRVAPVDRCDPRGRGRAVTDAVTLHVWQVRPRDVPAALVASRVTARRLHRHRDVSFAKVLGTATDAFLPTAVT